MKDGGAMAIKRRRAKGDGTLFKRGDGMWIGSVDLPTTNGRRRHKSVSSRDYATAVRKLRDLKSAIAAGQIATTGSTTVEKWLAHWLDTIHGDHVRPTTRRHYEQTIRLHINPHIGAKRLERLTPEDVRQMERAIQQTSTRAAQKAHQTLARALKDAVNEGLIYRNVAEAVRKPKHATQLRDAFSFDVARHILRTAISSSDEMWAARWLMGFFTGARQAEVLGLTWDRVDFVAGQIDLAWQLQRVNPDRVPPGFEWHPCEGKLAWTRPKTKAGTRVVDMAGPLHAALIDLAQSDGYNPHRLVFHQDGHPLTPETDRAAWKKLLRDAEVIKQVDGKWEVGPPLHSIRHTTATLLQAAGVDEPTRMALMGQSSVAAHRGYLHDDHTLTRRAVDQLIPLVE